MRRTRSLVAALAVLGSLSAVAPAGRQPASAQDVPAPQLSTSSGAGGTLVTVRATGCRGSEERLTQFRALLISGTGDDAVLAGVGVALDAEEGVTLVVPSWIDPAAPARVDAACVDYSAILDAPFDPEDPGADLPQPTIAIDYPDVDFDVLPGGRTDQTISVQPTSRRIGQASLVEATGCDLPGATRGEVIAYPGADPSGLGVFIAGAEIGAGAPVEADGFAAPLTFSDSDYGYGVGILGEELVEEEARLEAFENPTTLEAGPWTVITICGDEEGVVQVYEPQIVDVGGRAPIDDVDLTPSPVTDADAELVLAGGSCTAGAVTVVVDEDALADIFATFPGEEPGLERARRRRAASDPFGRAGARAIGPDDAVATVVVEPDADGSWSLPIDPPFDHGFVLAEATCGDPLADGWVYDVQIAVVDVERTPPTTPPTVAPPAPPAPTPLPLPALARPGRPAYAG